MSAKHQTNTALRHHAHLSHPHHLQHVQSCRAALKTASLTLRGAGQGGEVPPTGRRQQLLSLPGPQGGSGSRGHGSQCRGRPAAASCRPVPHRTLPLPGGAGWVSPATNPSRTDPRPWPCTFSFPCDAVVEHGRAGFVGACMSARKDGKIWLMELQPADISFSSWPVEAVQTSFGREAPPLVTDAAFCSRLAP